MLHLKALVSLLKVCLHFHAHKWCVSLVRLYPCWCTASSTVKIIMDKISKRSKGYAFIEYTTEEAASAALKEMNGKVSFLPLWIFLVFLLCLMFKRRFVFLKLWFIIVDKTNITFWVRERVISLFCSWFLQIINGWMIVVDVAKTNPPRYSRGRPR